MALNWAPIQIHREPFEGAQSAVIVPDQPHFEDCRHGTVQWLHITITAVSHHGKRTVVARSGTTRARVLPTRPPTRTPRRSTRAPRNLAMSLPQVNRRRPDTTRRRFYTTSSQTCPGGCKTYTPSCKTRTVRCRNACTTCPGRDTRRPRPPLGSTARRCPPHQLCSRPTAPCWLSPIKDPESASSGSQAPVYRWRIRRE